MFMGTERGRVIQVHERTLKRSTKKTWESLLQCNREATVGKEEATERSSKISQSTKGGGGERSRGGWWGWRPASRLLILRLKGKSPELATLFFRPLNLPLVSIWSQNLYGLISSFIWQNQWNMRTCLENLHNNCSWKGLNFVRLFL